MSYPQLAPFPTLSIPIMISMIGLFLGGVALIAGATQSMTAVILVGAAIMVGSILVLIYIVYRQMNEPSTEPLLPV